MGNAASDVTSGVKKQAEASTQKLYQLVDLKGCGILVELTKHATTTKNYAALDEAIKTRVEPFLYNGGEGKKFHISKLVLMRNRDRPKHKHIFKNEAQFDNYQEPTDCKDPSMYRDVCWRLDERGNVGESCLHLCVLSATPVHSELAKRLIMFYPKLINDVYMSDEYYGENVLHMAIVNEDPQMVKFFLDSGANVNERCFGAFMSPEDQKPSRMDTLEHEHVICDPQTNYKGLVYWGEYPACFAACVDQEECYRLLLAKGANPNAQDSNGNTVLHLLVIHDKKAMFNTGYELGAEMNIKNNLNLTPLTLAAKLAKKELFFHILNISREIYWQIGSVTCAAYPLGVFDTIDTETGGIQKESALNLIVFGETTEHLELMEGPVDDLLQTKWNTFIKARFYRQFILFLIYFLITATAFVLRPIHKGGQHRSNATAATILEQQLVSVKIKDEETGSPSNNSEFDNFENISLSNTSYNRGDIVNTNETIPYDTCFDPWDSVEDTIRLMAEAMMLLGACAYLIGAARECHYLGASMFFENLATVPSRVMFLSSRILVLIMTFFRFMCWKEVEDFIAVVCMLTTAPYFLFFCRGFKTVGPFVVMIYRMITGDLLRFVIIYLVFIMGFSQAYFIIFRSFHKANNPLGSPAESIIAMFMMSLSFFDETFQSFKETDHNEMAQFLFVVYMAIVTILLINMLIAMMGNTYTKIAETKNEWQRQWARIVLVVERGVSPYERHRRQEKYSQPTADGSRALVLRLNQTEDEKEEMKELLDIRRYHDKAIQKRMAKMMEGATISRRRSIVNTLHQHHQHQELEQSAIMNSNSALKY